LHEYKARQKAREARQDEKKAARGFGKATFRNPDRVARFTWWVAVFTGLLFVTAFLQTWAFIQSERAYLSVGNFGFVGGLNPTNQLALAFKIRNSGKSAANPTHMSISWALLLTSPLRQRPVMSLAVNPIPAGDTQQHLFRAYDDNGTPSVLPQAIIDAIQKEEIRFYVYGAITYEDDFLPERTTEFCYKYLPRQSSGGISAFGGCPVQEFIKIK